MHAMDILILKFLLPLVKFRLNNDCNFFNKTFRRTSIKYSIALEVKTMLLFLILKEKIYILLFLNRFQTKKKKRTFNRKLFSFYIEHLKLQIKN